MELTQLEQSHINKITAFKESGKRIRYELILLKHIPNSLPFVAAYYFRSSWLLVPLLVVCYGVFVASSVGGYYSIRFYQDLIYKLVKRNAST